MRVSELGGCVVIEGNSGVWAKPARMTGQELRVGVDLNGSLWGSERLSWPV